MKYLFINTSTKKLVVSIIIDNKIEYLYENEADNNLSIDLLPVVKEAFDKTKLDIKDIDCIFVTNGPGSFTGIRIGLTVVKVIAWSLNIKVIPLSSLELMASSTNGYTMPLMDARRGYVFAALYDDNLDPVYKDTYIEMNSFIEKVNKDGYKYEIVSDDFDYTSKEYNLLKVIKKHENDVGVNPHTLNPNYLKMTEAEEKLNEGR